MHRHLRQLWTKDELLSKTADDNFQEAKPYDPYLLPLVRLLPVIKQTSVRWGPPIPSANW